MYSREFDSRWSVLDFSLSLSLQPHYGPEVNPASNRNEYQGISLGGKGGRGLGMTNLPPSCADYTQILGASTSSDPWAYLDLHRDSLTFLLKKYNDLFKSFQVLRVAKSKFWFSGM
jgi:hypothetical protein